MANHWTPLRRAILEAVGKGQVTAVGRAGWNFRCRPSTGAQMARAANWLYDHGYIATLDGSVLVTEEGQSELGKEA